VGDEGAGLGAWLDVQMAAQHGPFTLDRWMTANRLVKAQLLYHVAPGFKFSILPAEYIAVLSVALRTNSESTQQDLQQNVIFYTIT